MEKKDPANKSWANLKIHFTKARQDLKDSQKIGISTGYQANSVETNETYEPDNQITIKNIVRASIKDCKKNEDSCGYER